MGYAPAGRAARAAASFSAFFLAIIALTIIARGEEAGGGGRSQGWNDMFAEGWMGSGGP